TRHQPTTPSPQREAPRDDEPSYCPSPPRAGESASAGPNAYRNRPATPAHATHPRSLPTTVPTGPTLNPPGPSPGPTRTPAAADAQSPTAPPPTTGPRRATT